MQYTQQHILSGDMMQRLELALLLLTCVDAGMLLSHYPTGILHLYLISLLTTTMRRERQAHNIRAQRNYEKGEAGT